MDLSLTGEQAALVAALGDLYGTHASPERVRAAEPLGFDKGLWDQLLALGLIEMAVDEDADHRASEVDLALAAEQQGRAVAPAPVIEAQVAARVLAAVGSPALEPVLAGERLVTIALHPVNGGAARAVPAAAVADDAVVFDGERLLLVPLEGARTPFENVGAQPLADVAVPADAHVLATGAEALAVHEEAVDDWLRLTAAALVGIGARALELGVAYVKERKAWGVPIGSFQSVAHNLADAATAIDGARLLAQEAAWAHDVDDPRAAELTALAFAVATEAARDASYKALHFHGGYGFTLEYDVQLYWRRARAWAAVWGEPAAAYRRAADARYGRTA
ncbi:MAG TPA: acyl-CoA dehydrogenase family protein [Mycobacteriales bacterium]|nr:acyl-CoA dehydrogenase family protein [Mycobacteriales bacterium]